MIGAVGNEPWLIGIILTLVIIVVIGIIWGTLREGVLVAVTKERDHNVKDMLHTFDGLTSALKDVEHQVEKSDELSESRRQELMRSVSDIERRLMHAIRELAQQLSMARIVGSSGTNVNISGDNAHVAQGQSVNQGARI